MHLTNENEIVQLNNNISNNVSSRSLRMTNLNQLVLNDRIAVWATQALKIPDSRVGNTSTERDCRDIFTHHSAHMALS